MAHLLVCGGGEEGSWKRRHSRGREAEPVAIAMEAFIKFIAVFGLLSFLSLVGEFGKTN
jgi:hypothetical protein